MEDVLSYLNLTWLLIQVHNNFYAFCQLSITLKEQYPRVQQEGARRRAIVTACFSGFTHSTTVEAVFMKRVVLCAWSKDPGRNIKHCIRSCINICSSSPVNFAIDDHSQEGKKSWCLRAVLLKPSKEEKGMHGHESMHELEPGDGCGMQSSMEERLQQKVLSKRA